MWRAGFYIWLNEQMEIDENGLGIFWDAATFMVTFHPIVGGLREKPISFAEELLKKNNENDLLSMELYSALKTPEGWAARKLW